MPARGSRAMTAPTDLCITAPRAPMHALLNGAPSSRKTRAQIYTGEQGTHVGVELGAWREAPKSAAPRARVSLVRVSRSGGIGVARRPERGRIGVGEHHGWEPWAPARVPGKPFPFCSILVQRASAQSAERSARKFSSRATTRHTCDALATHRCTRRGPVAAWTGCMVANHGHPRGCRGSHSRWVQALGRALSAAQAKSRHARARATPATQSAIGHNTGAQARRDTPPVALPGIGAGGALLPRTSGCMRRQCA